MVKVKANCSKCKYRGYVGNGNANIKANLICDYFEITGSLRGCKANENCTWYKPGNPVKEKKVVKPIRSHRVMLEPENETAKKIFRRKPYV